MTALLAIVFAAAAASDAGVNAYVAIDPPVIPFHRQARFSVVVEAPGDVEVALPDIARRFGGLAIYGPPDRRVEPLPDGRRRLIQTYVLDPVFIGYYPIAPIEVRLDSGDSLIVPSPALHVRDLTEDEAREAMRFEQNAAPIRLSAGLFRAWWFRILLAALVVAALAALYVYLRSRRTEAPAPVVPPWDVAYARLRDLDARDLPGAGNHEAFYVELSDILRSYIEQRFALHAPERTTPEFLSEAAGSGALTEAHQRRLARFLRHSDRVKFARYQPTVDEMENSFALVLHFIDETVPSPESGGEEAAA